MNIIIISFKLYIYKVEKYIIYIIPNKQNYQSNHYENLNISVLLYFK